MKLWLDAICLWNEISLAPELPLGGNAVPARVELVTFCNFLPSVDLADFLLKQLVTPLTDGHDLLIGRTELGDSFEHLLGDLSCGLIFCKSIWIVESVVCSRRSQSDCVLEALKRIGHN